MNVAVKFYIEGNSENLPIGWPSEVKELGESVELPDNTWTLMTVEAFAAYKVQKNAEYDAAMAPKLLAETKVAKITQLQESANAFLDSHYQPLIRQQFMNLYTLAKFDNLIIRAAYIRVGIDWINSLTTYVLNRAGAINAQTTVAAVNAITWNFETTLGVDPALTLFGALSIVS